MLIENFKDVVDEEFTAKMENQFDEIAEGKVQKPKQILKANQRVENRGPAVYIKSMTIYGKANIHLATLMDNGFPEMYMHKLPKNAKQN